MLPPGWKREIDENRKEANSEVVGQIGALTEQLTRYKEQQRTLDHSRRRREITTIFLILITAIIGLLTAFIFYYQLRTLDDQLQEARLADDASKRAWIYADFVPWNQIATDQNGDLTISINFVMHNTGHEPAVNVYPAADVRIAQKPDEVVSAQRHICDKRQNDKSAERVLGSTVFPGQTFVVGDKLHMAKDDWMKRQSHGAAGPLILGCIDYQSSGNPTRHTTGFAFFVGLLNDKDNTIGALPIDPSSVPVSHLAILNWLEGDAFSAN
jgi:hypothetical protein